MAGSKTHAIMEGARHAVPPAAMKKHCGRLRNRRSLLALILALGSVLECPAAQAWDESLLEKGEILLRLEDPPHGGWAEGIAAAIIDCPTEETWLILNDYNHLKDFIPGIVESRIESVDGDTVIYFEETDVPILKNPWLILRCEHDNQNHAKKMTMVKGSFDSLSATWSLTPYGEGKTLAEYRLLSDPGFYVPRWIQKLILNKTVKGFFRGLRKECERRAR